MWLLSWHLVLAPGIFFIVFVSLLCIYQISETSLSFAYTACINEFGQCLMILEHFLIVNRLEELLLEEAFRNSRVGPNKLNHL